MEKIDLNIRDRRNIYREDADNVTAVEVDINEKIDLHEIDDQLTEITDNMRQQGNRFAYLVMKISR